MNPCRCGYLGDGARECKKAPTCGEDYKNKISGPLLDRIDISINVPQVDIFANNTVRGEGSEAIAARVLRARNLQRERYSQEPAMEKLPKINSRIDGKTLEKFTELDESCQKILQKSIEKMATSMRGITRILRVARTIADLEESEKIHQSHLLEAISYRRKI